MATKAVATRSRTVFVRAPKRRRNGNGGGRFGSKKIPLAIIAGLVPGVSFAVNNPERSFRQGMERIIWTYTGFVPWDRMRWDSGGLVFGLYPLLGGGFAHWLANLHGLNRAVAKIPYVQI